MSELDRAVHIGRESLREEINRNRQEVARSGRTLEKKERTSTWRRTCREWQEKRNSESPRLRDEYGEVKNSARASPFGTLDTKIDAMMKRANSGYHG